MVAATPLAVGLLFATGIGALLAVVLLLAYVLALLLGSLSGVIAFGLSHDEQLVGDVYVCPSVARQSARRYKVPVREELVRLVVHGTLHVLGRDHDGGDRRELSPMWRRQEDYVTQVVGSSR